MALDDDGLAAESATRISRLVLFLKKKRILKKSKKKKKKKMQCQ